VSVGDDWPSLNVSDEVSECHIRMKKQREDNKKKSQLLNARSLLLHVPFTLALVSVSL
jgi:hypothetical protein